MLNKDGQRELCYVVRIDDIRSIIGRDKVECAVVGGWTIMVRKGQFNVGDLAIYFEIDSKVPDKEPFKFLESKNFKIKTQKYALKDAEGNKVGQFFSQGLLMAAEDFGWIRTDDYIIDMDNQTKMPNGTFLTKTLSVIYADAADNKRKSNKSDPNKKYQRMMNRHPKLAKSKFGRWCMKHDFAKKLLFLLLGRNKDYPVGYSSWVIKTDEERIQNLTHLIPDFQNEEWIATEREMVAQPQ